MKKLLIGICILVMMVQAEVEIKVLGTGYVHPIAGHYNTEDAINIEASIDEYKVLGDNFAVYGKLSNRLKDTPIDKAYIEYTTRGKYGSTEVRAGTITTFKGVFDRTVSSDKRIPIIYLPSGVYNDEWMSGFLDTVVGGSVKQSGMVGTMLISGSATIGVPRELDRTKIESGGFNYESELSDVDIDRVFKSATLQVDCTNVVELFRTHAVGGFKIEDTSGMTDLEKYMYVVGTGDGYDKSILLSGKEFTFTIDRIGGIVRFNDITITYEQFRMLLETVGYTKESKGKYVYANVDMGKYVPYISAGTSVSGHTAYESIAGVKINVANNTTLLVEYRKSDWVQTTTIEQYNEWNADGRPKAEVVLVEVIRTW